MSSSAVLGIDGSQQAAILRQALNDRLRSGKLPPRIPRTDILHILKPTFLWEIYSIPAVHSAGQCRCFLL